MNCYSRLEELGKGIVAPKKVNKKLTKNKKKEMIALIETSPVSVVTALVNTQVITMLYAESCTVEDLFHIWTSLEKVQKEILTTARKMYDINETHNKEEKGEPIE